MSRCTLHAVMHTGTCRHTYTICRRVHVNTYPTCTLVHVDMYTTCRRVHVDVCTTCRRVRIDIHVYTSCRYLCSCTWQHVYSCWRHNQVSVVFCLGSKPVPTKWVLSNVCFHFFFENLISTCSFMMKVLKILRLATFTALNYCLTSHIFA